MKNFLLYSTLLGSLTIFSTGCAMKDHEQCGCDGEKKEQCAECHKKGDEHKDHHMKGKMKMKKSDAKTPAAPAPTTPAK